LSHEFFKYNQYKPGITKSEWLNNKLEKVAEANVEKRLSASKAQAESQLKEIWKQANK